ncbi:hypothetical protein HGRIS_003024 [Hohenbuehelia grisea]|uniref:Major facilitator superfamily (MFS) profile domain-containing protein n=1 Tax=Hohenbuehelia grisea TaxID=104357 RepID=A0ABR3JP70_9AGAR
MLSVAYTVGRLKDRTNLGNAQVAGLQKDLKLTPHQYSVCLTITFVPYILIELPSNLLIKVMGPHRLIPTLLALWGLVTTLQGFVHNYSSLLVCRFFLGLFEGGLTPGLVLYLSTFYPRERLQRRVSLVISTASLAGVFSGLLAASIVKMSGNAGRPGWAWIFIIEGMVTVLFGIFFFFVMPASPKDCGLLKEDEKEMIMQQLRNDGAISADDSCDQFSWGEVSKALQAPHQLLLNALSFFHGTLLYSVSYFVPTILLSLGYDHNAAQLMSVPPYAVSFVVTNAASFFADQYHCRGAVIMFGGIMCTLGFAMFHGSYRHSVQYGSLFFTICGANVISPATGTWAANNNSPHIRRATAIALVPIFANTGGILSTWLMGFISRAPRYEKATIVLLVFGICVALCSAANVAYLSQQNKKRAAIRAKHAEALERPGLGDRSAWFTYIL